MRVLSGFYIRSISLVSFVLMLGLSVQLHAAATGEINLTKEPLNTLPTTPGGDIKPNVMFVLDTSGSMTWSHMPDDQSQGNVDIDFGYYGARSSQCNQVYYDPNITYTPPKKADKSSYPDMDFEAALDNGYNPSSGTISLSTEFRAIQESYWNGNAIIPRDNTYQSAYYYTYSGTETDPKDKTYYDTGSTFFQECENESESKSGFTIGDENAGVDGIGPATGVSGKFTRHELSSAISTTSTTITVSNDGNWDSVTGVAVGGTNLLAYATSWSNSSTTVASRIATAINANAGSGYSASASGRTVTIVGPASAAGHTPIISKDGSKTFTTAVFPAATTIPAQGTAAELTNFANWYSYYRTRILMMKSATTTAFDKLTGQYRVGLMKLTDSNGTPTVRLNPFTEGSAHRIDWFNKLIAANPSGGTPLRTTLAQAGKYYAGQLSGADPVEYSCQQNFTILSTDGFWNGGTPTTLAGGTSEIGQQDGDADRPYFDGAFPTGATVAATLYQRTRNDAQRGNCSSGYYQRRERVEQRTCEVVDGVPKSCPNSLWQTVETNYSGACKNRWWKVSLPNPKNTATVPLSTSTYPALDGGADNSLADVAMYYYETDLRPGDCVLCEDNVFASGNDNANTQHMTTFTLGLGASGLMQYDPGYASPTNTTSDYAAIAGSKAASAAGGICTWQADGTLCNWPEPKAGEATAIDDLWHAAVNGRGSYFSATNPATLSSGLTNALSGIEQRRGAAAAAATSTLNPVAGDNQAFVASYATVAWTGNLEGRDINVATGEVSESATWCVEPIAPPTCAGNVTEETVGGATVTYCTAPGLGSTCSGGEILGNGDCKTPIAKACDGTLAQRVADGSRKIWTNGPNAATLNNFHWIADGGDIDPAVYDPAALSGLSQWPSYIVDNSVAPAINQQQDAKDSIIDYLRGDKTKEFAAGAPFNLFRDRDAVLGDAIESQPAFIGKPTFSYLDTGYATFKSVNSTRSGTIYMGTNDGMLHAINSENGEERWAFVPSMVIPKMWKLADRDYANNHEYLVNGSPVISDVYYDSAWHTILVGGLNGGGRGYYALDITDPAAPTFLWEFTPNEDADIGYSFGRPVITKKDDGTWVVLLTSGYNNGSKDRDGTNYIAGTQGDGLGRLYVLNPKTGAKISEIIATDTSAVLTTTSIPADATETGMPSIPSGLAQISAFAEEGEKNNTAVFVYGGDLLGNVWRFDINAETAVRFARLTDDGGEGQPVTTKPEIGNVVTADGYKRRVVFVGTGQYLSQADLATTQVQTIYAIKDTDVASGTPSATFDARATNALVHQTFTVTGTERFSQDPTNDVNFITDRGWLVDFPAGERISVSPQLVSGTLLVPTTVPSSTICAPGGESWFNFFDYRNGGAVGGEGELLAIKADGLIVGLNVLYVTSPDTGKIEPKVNVVTGNNPTPQLLDKIKFSGSGSGFQTKRAIWRELIE